MAGASVVNADGIAHATAQQLMDRLAAGPTNPQRDIDGRTAAHFNAAASKQIADQMRLMGLDGQGSPPQQIGRDDAHGYAPQRRPSP